MPSICVPQDTPPPSLSYVFLSGPVRLPREAWSGQYTEPSASVPRSNTCNETIYE